MFKERRRDLVEKVHEQFKGTGPIVLIANFENECCAFKQESSFYYYTGVNEPGCIAVISPNAETTLYIPRFQDSRSKWVSDALDSTDQKVGDIEDVAYLGEPVRGYHLSPSVGLAAYSNILALLEKHIALQDIYTLFPEHSEQYASQKLLLMRFFTSMQGLENRIKDVSPVVTRMRQKKSAHEISLIKKAIGITHAAQKEAALYIQKGSHEAEVHMALEKEMRRAGAQTAFPSIVAGGKNSCVLHYSKNYCDLNEGDVVVVDIGAQVDGYCADITRTYAVKGNFSPRQQEVYNLVLATQQYIHSLARPGLWLSNKNKPDQSLHHLALEFLNKHGYGHYFTHGIGHHLGLDVHDVGDYSLPLAEGDVFTIEPGIYIPEEAIGVRIEDDYLVTSDGVTCLSDAIPK